MLIFNNMFRIHCNVNICLNGVLITFKWSLALFGSANMHNICPNCCNVFSESGSNFRPFPGFAIVLLILALCDCFSFGTLL